MICIYVAYMFLYPFIAPHDYIWMLFLNRPFYINNMFVDRFFQPRNHGYFPCFLFFFIHRNSWLSSMSFGVGYCGVCRAFKVIHLNQNL